MKTLSWFLLVLPPIIRGVSLNAQERQPAEVARAAVLNDRGEFGATTLLLEPFLHANAHALSRADAGDAWNLLGRAYLFLGEYQKARRSFEAARIARSKSANTQLR